MVGRAGSEPLKPESLDQPPLWERSVARGLAPVGPRSGPQESEIPGLLRSPTGASPLATAHSYKGSVRSVAYCEPLARVLRHFHFIDQRNRIIGKRDPAAPFSAHQQIILANAEPPRALAFDKLRRG